MSIVLASSIGSIRGQTRAPGIWYCMTYLPLALTYFTEGSPWEVRQNQVSSRSFYTQVIPGRGAWPDSPEPRRQHRDTELDSRRPPPVFQELQRKETRALCVTNDTGRYGIFRGQYFTTRHESRLSRTFHLSEVFESLFSLNSMPEVREVAGGGTTSSDAEHSPDSPDIDSSLEFDKGNAQLEKANAIPNDFLARCAKFMARNAWTHFFVALLVAIALSAIGLTVGNFNVAVDNAGWQTRGTLIADRHQQVLLVLKHLAELSNGDSTSWTELEDNVQPGWESAEGDDIERRLSAPPDGHEWIRRLESNAPLRIASSIPQDDRNKSFAMSESMARALQDSSGFEGCDVSSYFNTELDKTKLWPMWKTTSSVSAHDPAGIREICIAETNTQAVLEANNLCNKCDSGRCQPPFSLVLLARITVGDTALELSCEDLANEWSKVVIETDKLMRDCVPDITLDYVKFGSLPDLCPSGFSPIMVDDLYGPANNVIEYTSSIFQTVSDPKALYELAGQFDRAAFSEVVYGAYDTANEAFNEYYVDVSVGNDMILAL